jgi:hypothetical protein
LKPLDFDTPDAICASSGYGGLDMRDVALEVEKTPVLHLEMCLGCKLKYRQWRACFSWLIIGNVYIKGCACLKKTP